MIWLKVMPFGRQVELGFVAVGAGFRFFLPALVVPKWLCQGGLGFECLVCWPKSSSACSHLTTDAPGSGLVV